MKKVNNKLNILIVLCSALIIILLIVLLIIWGSYHKNNNGSTENAVNNYNISEDVIDLPDTIYYSNETLTKEHCLNSICISNASFQYRNNEGTVYYDITNIGDSIESGLLKMNFSGTSLIVVFQEISPKKTISSSSQYVGMEILNKDDFVLEELDKSDMDSVIK